MAQYKHDRFFKFYLQSLYKSKGTTQQNIQVRNDEDLEIDLMFISDQGLAGWDQEDLGLLDNLMKVHPTIVVEHYSSYLEETDLNKSITRKNLYWEPKQKELVEAAKKEQKLTSSNRLSKEATEQIEEQNPFTWILTVNCSQKILRLCDAKPAPEIGAGVYRLCGLLRMGIVVISQLEDSSETLWLRMLGNRDSAQQAFGSIDQLPLEQKRKNDMIDACVRYCVYLKTVPNEFLTAEEEDFMKTMAEVDEWYEAQMIEGELQGKTQGEVRAEIMAGIRGELKGEARGEIRGKAIGEQLQKRSIALGLVRKGIDLATISEVTGLTVEQLTELRDNG